SPARGTARPFPAADRHRLSGQGVRAAHAGRHHLRRGGAAGRGVQRGRPDDGAADRAAHPGGREGGDSILKLVRAARPGEEGAKDTRDAVAWGPGRRASQAFMLAVRARALIEGRLAPSTDDVEALAQPVLRHRMALTFPARAEGMTVAGVIERLCRSYL